MCEAQGCRSWKWPGDVGESFQGSTGSEETQSVWLGGTAAKLLEPAQQPLPQILLPWLGLGPGSSALGFQEPLGPVPCRDVKKPQSIASHGGKNIVVWDPDFQQGVAVGSKKILSPGFREGILE